MFGIEKSYNTFQGGGPYSESVWFSLDHSSTFLQGTAISHLPDLTIKTWLIALISGM